MNIPSVADIVLGSSKIAQNRVEQGLPQSQWPDFREEWRRPGQRMSWTDFFLSLPPEYQQKARQDKAREQQSRREQRQNPVVEPASAVAAPTQEPDLLAPDEGNLGAGGVESVPEGVSAGGESPQQFLARLRDGVNQFGRRFNQTTIRPYNNAIQHALQAIKSLSQLPEISPEIAQQGEQLLQLFGNIQASDTADTQLITQLGQLAYQLGQAAGAYQSGAASNTKTRGPQQQSWWQRMSPRLR